MSEGAFRQAGEIASGKAAEAPAPERSDPEIVMGPDSTDDEAPIALYTEVEGHPYTAEYFEVLEIYKDPDIGLHSEVLDIEDAYRQKVTTGELEDSRKTFKAFIKEAEKATDCENASKPVKIAKIAAWVKFMNDLEKVDRNRN